MHLSLPPRDLTAYVAAQINTLFPDPYPVAVDTIAGGVDDALDRVDFCFKHAKPKRYQTDGQSRFDHLYSDQYVIFLWYLANSLYRRDADVNALNKIYYLNKALHAFDSIYSNRLPDIFLVIHGVGTVLGNAEYANYFVTYQGCTVGQNHGKFPVFGEGVGLGAGAAVIGASRIGAHVSVGSGVTLIDRDVAERHSALRTSRGQLVTRVSQRQTIAQDYFIGI